MVFVFGSVYAVDYTYRLTYVKLALHPRNEGYLIVMDMLFDVLLQSISQYFIQDFCINAIMDIGLKLSFLVEFLLGFGIRMMLVS